MMVIVGVIKQTGVFDFLAIWAAKRSRGQPYRLMVMLMVITAIASPFLDNVTTIMLVAPVTIVVCERLGIAAAAVPDRRGARLQHRRRRHPDRRPAEHHHRQPRRADVQRLPGPHGAAVVVIFVLFVVLTRVLFRTDLRANPGTSPQVMALQERRAIKDTRLLVRCLVVLALVIVGFGLHAVLHVAPSIVALLGAGRWCWSPTSTSPTSCRRSSGRRWCSSWACSSWSPAWCTPASSTRLGTWAVGTFGDNYFGAATALLFGSAVLGAFFDNIPYVATMAPVVEGMVAQAPDAETGAALWWAFALGADFGGNGTAVAASANVVAIGIAARGPPDLVLAVHQYGIVVTC